MTKKEIGGSRMFPFITKTCNPLGGRCPHNCLYCWSMSKNGLVNRLNMKKYRGPIQFYQSALNKLSRAIDLWIKEQLAKKEKKKGS